MFMLLAVTPRDLMTILVFGVLIIAASHKPVTWAQAGRAIVLRPIASLLIAIGLYIAILLASNAIAPPTVHAIAQVPAKPAAPKIGA